MNTRLQVEHPITEEITGIDLVEQQILIGAGYPLAFKQSDVKINGHSVEYRVYAEDPSRKFLPSIGFLTKYKEPTPNENIRIDTGVTEGSEISMYYDPMISKLITWGKDRKSAMSLMEVAMEEYVIRGVVNNIGFGQSILRNKSFAEGNYSTAFIPTFYPTGYRGETHSVEDEKHLSIAAHYIRNLQRQNIRFQNHPEIKEESVLYIVMKGKEHDTDYKVVHHGGTYTITNVATGESSDHKTCDFNFEYGTLLRFEANGAKQLIQFEDTRAEVNFHLSIKGSDAHAVVYDPVQYRVKRFMAPPKVVDHTKRVISPMPGGIVSIAVEEGETVLDGQELFVIEAMKMQNIIKSQRDGKIKKIHVTPGVSVSVDQLLIEYE